MTYRGLSHVLGKDCFQHVREQLAVHELKQYDHKQRKTDEQDRMFGLLLLLRRRLEDLQVRERPITVQSESGGTDHLAVNRHQQSLRFGLVHFASDNGTGMWHCSTLVSGGSGASVSDQNVRCIPGLYA